MPKLRSLPFGEPSPVEAPPYGGGCSTDPDPGSLPPSRRAERAATLVNRRGVTLTRFWLGEEDLNHRPPGYLGRVLYH